MKTLTITITDEDFARLAALATVLDITPERYIETEGMDWMIEGMEGNVADNLACRIWDNPEEAKRAAVKADAIDETAYWWAILKRPEGDFLLEAGESDIAKARAAGNILVDCGLSEDWKEAA